MKKVVLIFILLSSTSLWSESRVGTYDCSRIGDYGEEFTTISLPPVKAKIGGAFALNSLPLDIYDVSDLRIFGNKKNKDGVVILNVILFQAVSALLVDLYDDDGTTLKSSKRYNCKFRMWKN